jgi:hypothetical protein
LEFLQKIKLTEWETLKTEGIDFSVDFVWFDYDFLEAEKKELLKQDAYSRFHQVNLTENPDQLRAIKELDFINFK